MNDKGFERFTMNKRVLVIGGSYFTGRVFSIISSRNNKLDLHVVNRGKYVLNLPNVSEYKCDRHEPERLSGILPDIKFDAVIDFCGYKPGEINAIINALPGRIGQYIFISTSSVYDSAGVKKEGDAVLKTDDADLVLEYVSNKIRLEHELMETCAINSIPFTIVRPAFIYGPFNYAPRESYFIKHIVKDIPVPYPVDAKAKFSMVYVADVARALEMFAGDERAYNEEFNLAFNDVTYDLLFSELERCNGAPFKKNPVTVARVFSENIPLPFPLDKDDLCSGEKIKRIFGFEYTSFAEGMDKTFAAFKSVFA
jgi:2'-hydroxyisoflavone reductase